MKDYPKTVLEFERRFATEEACRLRLTYRLDSYEKERRCGISQVQFLPRGLQVHKALRLAPVPRIPGDGVCL